MFEDKAEWSQEMWLGFAKKKLCTIACANASGYMVRFINATGSTYKKSHPERRLATIPPEVLINCLNYISHRERFYYDDYLGAHQEVLKALKILIKGTGKFPHEYVFPMRNYNIYYETTEYQSIKPIQ